MPSGLIENDHGMCARRDVKGDFSRCIVIASLLQAGMTMPTALPPNGQIAPKIQAEDRR